MDITTLRRAIDKLDGRIVKTLSRRMAVSVRVAKLKAALGLPARDRQRERFITKRAAANARHPLSPRAAEAVMKKILEITRATTKAARNKGKR